MIYGDGEMGAELETLGMCARRLRVVDDPSPKCLTKEVDEAGQGAHREVGSEGFAANHRAVAEQGEPVGQNPGENRAGTMAAKEILGAPGCIKVCAGGTVGKEHALPREISYGPATTGDGYDGWSQTVNSSRTHWLVLASLEPREFPLGQTGHPQRRPQAFRARQRMTFLPSSLTSLCSLLRQTLNTILGDRADRVVGLVRAFSTSARRIASPNVISEGCPINCLY